MWRSKHPMLLLFLSFLPVVKPDGTLEEHPEQYDFDIFYRNAYNPYQFINNDGFTSKEEYEDADPCSEDQCNRGGFCYRLEASKFSCDCLSTRAGQRCENAYVDFSGSFETSNYTELAEIDPRCEGVECNGNGECVLVNVGTLGLSSYEASCGCNMGYSEADNCLTWTGCDSIQCSNHGACVESEINGVKALDCVCETGWTGSTCALVQRECTEGILVKMVNQLAQFDQEAAQTCAHVWPFAPYVSTPAAVCDCLNAVALHLPEFFDENNCILDHRSYNGWKTLGDIRSQYCSSCTTQEIQVSLQGIIDESSVCEYFYNYQHEMPLHMKAYWQCQCYASLGITSEEIQPHLSCPMQEDSFLSTELTSWSSCDAEEDSDGENSVCEYQQVYKHLKSDLADFSVKASETCSAAWESLLLATDAEANLARYASTFCDCFDLLNAFHEESLNVFNCKVLPTHQATARDLFTQYCYTPEVNSQDCVKEAVRYAALLAVNNDVRGSLTSFQALRAAAAADSLSDPLNELMCYAYEAGVILELGESEMFNFQKCESVAGFFWVYESNCDHAVVEINDVSTIVEATIFTTGGSGDYWETQLRWASLGTLLGSVAFGVVGYRYGKVGKPREGLVYTTNIPYAHVDEN